MEIKIFKNRKKFKKGGFHANPNIGWELILYIAFLLIITALVFGVYLFMHTNKEFMELSQNDNPQIKIVKKGRIEKILEYFSLRESKSAEILNSSSSIVDPSL
jgi:hypothetical protein